MAFGPLIESLDDNPFWDYALALYAKPDVAPACLALQNRHGLNVNLLLFCLWAGQNGRTLAPGEFERVGAAIAPWEDSVIKPLRRVRDWLKVQDLVPQEPGQALRKAVLARELEGEALEQGLIVATIEIAPGEPAPEIAAQNLATYLEAAGVDPDLEDRVALGTALSAAFPAAKAVEGLSGEARGDV